MSAHESAAPAWRILAPFVENGTDSIVLLDPSGTILYVSPSTTRMLGYAPEHLLGTSVFERVHDADRGRMQAAFARGLEQPGIPIQIVCRYRHDDGSWRELEGVGVNHLPDPSIQGIIVTYRDATAQKRAEAAVRAGEDQDRYLVEHASDIIYRCDIDGRFTFCNPTAVRLMKHTREELLGRHFLTLIRPDYRDQAGRFYASQLRDRVPTTYFEFPAVAKDGTEIWFGQNVQLVMSDGQVVGVQAMARDITEQRAREETRRQAQKMEAMGRLAGEIAHDFGNLLTAILGSSDLLLLQLAPGDPLRAEADAIRVAAERGASLTRGLLAFSRPQHGPVKVMDLGGLVRNLEPMLHRLVPDRIAIRILAGHHPVPVEADEAQIAQVVMNLVVNARDAMPAGGTITVDVCATDVDRTWLARLGLAPGGYARLSVVDTGHGIDADQRGRLFEPFFTTKAPDKGTGLGLSIVYGIVKERGGAIAVASEPGQGSAFDIYLPLARQPQ